MEKNSYNHKTKVSASNLKNSSKINTSNQPPVKKEVLSFKINDKNINKENEISTKKSKINSNLIKIENNHNNNYIKSKNSTKEKSISSTNINQNLNKNLNINIKDSKLNILNYMNVTSKNITNSSDIDIPIDFLKISENRKIPSTAIPNLIITQNSDNNISKYKIPSDPLERVFWVLELFKNNQKLINYVKNAPERTKSSLDEIAKYLNKFSEDILERNMLLFTWVSMNIEYDTRILSSNKQILAEDYSPENVFKNGYGVCCGYSGLFDLLSKKMKLNSIPVSGYAKGYGYKKGFNFIQKKIFYLFLFYIFVFH